MTTKSRFVGDLSEDRLISTYFAPIAAALDDDVAELVPPSGQHLLVSTDALQEGIHFLRECPAHWVAQKALRANVSDILASGGKPLWFTLALSMPRTLELTWLEKFAAGLGEAATELGLQLVGGDTTASVDRLALSVTVMGALAPGRRVTRSGARVGDYVAVTGFLGSANAGLDVILGRHELSPQVRQALMARHFCPPLRPAFAQALAAQGLATAMMDLSDGLLTDLPRLCRASGVGAQVELGLVPLATDLPALGYTVVDAVRGGEDYELLLTCDPAHWNDLCALAVHCETPLAQIGTIEPGNKVLWLQDGVPQDFRLPTWKHFA